MRVAFICARERAAVSAIVKHPACAAPINSSGLVADSPSSNRDLNEYGPSNAPLPTFNRPLRSARLPNHSASAFLDAINLLLPYIMLLLGHSQNHLAVAGGYVVDALGHKAAHPPA